MNDNVDAGAGGDEDEVELVQLTPQRLTGQGVIGGETHPFTTLKEAVAYAMEHLTPEERESCFIRTAEGPIQQREMERLYRSTQQQDGPGTRAEPGS